MPAEPTVWLDLGAAFWPAFVVAGEFALKLVVIGFILLRRPRPPATNLAWITLILAVPVFGILAYLLVGEVRLGRRRTRRYMEVQTRLRRTFAAEPTMAVARRPAVPAPYRPLAALAETVGDAVPVGGNRLALIGATDEFIARLVEDIDRAHHHCHLLYYIFLDDHSGHRVADALVRAAGRGVACRLLVDAVGSRPFTTSRLRRRLAAAGVTVVEALPANVLRMLFARLDLRNHRKIAVIDGVIGYTGSQNIADAEFASKRRYGPWYDAAVRVEGPIVHELQMIFAQDWFLDTNERLAAELEVMPAMVPDGVIVQVMGTGPNSYNEALRQLNLSAFHRAQEELILTTPYFVPDAATCEALAIAARRGVRTTLIVPARNDSPLVAAASRAQYEGLLAAGVHIHEFEDGLLHAKTMTVDRDLALVSTANIDRRSFELNFEVSVLVYDTDFASHLRFLQTSYLDRSRRVTLRAWRRRRWPRRLWHSAAGVLSPIL